MSRGRHWAALPSPVQFMLLISDLVTALAAPFLAVYLRSLLEVGTTPRGHFVIYALGTSVLSLLLLWLTGCSRATWRYFTLEDAARAVRAIALGVAVGALCSFTFDRLQGVSRTVPLLQAGLQAIAFVGVRFAIQWLRGLNKSGAAKPKHVLVIGCSKAASAYVRAARELSGRTIDVVGLLSNDKTLVGQTIHGRPVLGAISDVAEIISTLQVHGIELWKLAVAVPGRSLSTKDAEAIKAAAQKFALPQIDVNVTFSEFLAIEEDVPVAALDVQAWNPLYALTKRSLDLLGSAFLLCLLSPLMLVLCAIVALDTGFPVLFWQQRLGKNGERLTVYKFRTMRAPLDSAGRRIPDAQRVSVVGYWMRKLRLDELPQLLSIVKGDMSFVGPRPLLPIDQPTDAARRLSVKPGLTGWAQVHGGNLVAIDDKNALDLWYVAHSSLRLDVEIVLRTIRMVFKGDSVDGRKIEQAKHWMRSFDLAAT